MKYTFKEFKLMKEENDFSPAPTGDSMSMPASDGEFSDFDVDEDGGFDTGEEVDKVQHLVTYIQNSLDPDEIQQLIQMLEPDESIPSGPLGPANGEMI